MRDTEAILYIVRNPLYTQNSVSLSITLMFRCHHSGSVHEAGVHYTWTVSVSQTVIQSVGQSGVSAPVQVYCVKSGVHTTHGQFCIICSCPLHMDGAVSQTVIQSVSQSRVSTVVQVYCVKSGVHYTWTVSVSQTVTQSAS